MIARMLIALGLVAGSTVTAFAACGSNAVVWIPGRWTVVGCQNVWVSGHYQQIEQTVCAPTTTRYWVAGHWENQGGASVWVSGHYEERVTETCYTTPIYTSEPACTTSTTVVVDNSPGFYFSYSSPVVVGNCAPVYRPVSSCAIPKPAVRHRHESAVSVCAPLPLPPLPHQVLPKLKDIPLPHEIIKKAFH